MIKKIILPTDGSDHANRAADLAADLADKYNAEIIVLHVLLRHQSVFDMLALARELKADSEIVEKLKELEEASMQAATVAYGGVISMPAPDDVVDSIGELICENTKSRIASRGDIRVRAYAVDGSPAERILMAEEHENADMIVMGSRGLGKLADIFMGSVSHKVSHLSKCTCVTVK